MIFYVTDANIFIDLHYAGLLNLMPQLGLPIVTTLLVADELNSEQLIELQSLINIKTLEIREVTIQEIRVLQLPPGLSLPDRSVICLAIRDNGALFSGDGLVRRTARNLGIDVYGLLWLFDQFVSKGLILPSEAAEKLEFLVVEKGSRQPRAEYMARVEVWRST